MAQYLIHLPCVAGIIAVGYGLFQTYRILRLPAGDEKMKGIAAAILEGANAYLKRQYLIVSLIAMIVGTGIYFLYGTAPTFAFVIGAVLSALSGIVGMSVSVRANVRTTEAAKSGLSRALSVAFNGGAVTGLMVAGLALIAVSAAVF